jgi:hypothetical protein
MAEGDPDGLLDDETIVALLRVRFSAGMPATITGAQTQSMIRPTVAQRHAYATWAHRCSGIGFPVAGPEMILGITDQRLLVWRPALLRSRPGRFAGAVELSRIRSAGVRRRVFAAVLTMLFEDGAIVGVETSRATRLRNFATGIPTYRDHRAR